MKQVEPTTTKRVQQRSLAGKKKRQGNGGRVSAIERLQAMKQKATERKLKLTEEIGKIEKELYTILKHEQKLIEQLIVAITRRIPGHMNPGHQEEEQQQLVFA